MGINPGKIVGIGGSGGAHAIASAAPPRRQGLRRAREDASINPAPNALVLFNPVLDTSKSGFGLDRFPTPGDAKKTYFDQGDSRRFPSHAHYAWHGGPRRSIWRLMSSPRNLEEEKFLPLGRI